jgi:flagellar hook protein FlgE
MSLYSAFYASLSGLSSNANALGVIGNNLANLNTVGYKSSTASFEDMFNAALGGSGTQGNGNPMQIGMGANLGSISQDFSQGSPQSSGNVTNMALQGSGFFTLKSTAGTTLYTRAGNFTVDKNGYLVDPSGNNVLGWNAVGGKVTANSTPVPIFVNPGATSPPVATANISNTTNLDASAAVGTTFTTPVAIYDSLGESHNLQITYTKGATNAATGVTTWTASLTTDGGGTITGAYPNLQFDSSGTLISPTTNPNLSITWPSGATNGSVNVGILSSSGAPNLTSYSAASATTATTQDGYAAGSVASMAVDQSGTLVGTFTNGQTMPLAQVAVTTFANANGLQKQGENTYAMTLASGAPVVGAAGSGGRGSVLGANLESSNVDVATEFTKLIVNQNGYQANSRVITTANTLLQTVIGLVQ